MERFTFTQRELSIAACIVEGKRDLEIADTFGTSRNTVKLQISRIRVKTDLQGATRIELANKLREILPEE